MFQSAKLGFVRPVDYVSVCKQCFHEYWHCVQYRDMFSSKDFHNYSEDFVRYMAEQAMIADVFPNYGSAMVVPDNYLKLSYELDAEKHAVSQVSDYLSDKFSNSMSNRLICDSINQRGSFWWGRTPVYRVSDAVADLDRRLQNCLHLVLQDVADASLFSGIVSQFMNTPDLIDTYRSLDVSE